LHAYNIYFQEERQKILKEIPSPPENEDDKKLTPGARRKRRRRGTHGKITFASLAKEIGFKWHNLDKEKKEHYQQLAEIELKRYDDEMDAYNLKQKEKEKEEQDSLDKKPKAKDVNDDETKIDDEEEEEDESEVYVDEEDSLSVTAVSAKKARER
jgi:HMG (high mobility group) box